jgi:hypothetical protein
MMAHRAEGGLRATRADTSPWTTHLGELERTATSAGIFHVRDSKITRIVVYLDTSARSPTSASHRRRPVTPAEKQVSRK